VFTKLTREIMLAARNGGGNLESNYALRLVVQKAKDNNMPSENIERAIKRATGGGEGANLAEVVFEGYGSNGVAVLMETLTDNRNRTVQEIRSILSRHGGSLGETGCVSWLFDTRGVITIDASGGGADDVALQAIDVGAEDVKTDGDYVEVYTEPALMEDVRKALEENFTVVSAEVMRVPKTTVMVDDSKAGQVMSFLDMLEQLDDVQHVYSNADFSDSALQSLEQG
jgi:YebC/PmpR family DNA-binding regulatory protein